MKRVFFIISGLFILGVIFGAIASFLYLSPRIYPGIKIAGISVGGMKKQEAENVLWQNIKKNKKNTIVLIYQNNKWVIDLKDFNYSPRPDITASKAYAMRDIKLLLRKQEKKLPLDFTLNSELLNKQIASISAQVSFPNQEPQIKIEENSISITPGEDGIELNIKKTEELLKKNISYLNFNAIPLPADPIKVAATLEQIKTTKARAQKLLPKKLFIKIDNNTNTLSGEELLSFIDFAGGFSKEKISAFSATLEESYNRPPQNATFQMENGKVTLFNPAEYGIKINKESAINQITDMLVNLENNKTESLTTKILITQIEPKINNQEVNSLGINNLLGRGISYYTGSAASRIYNLTLAASRVNGTLIPPEAVFSFNTTVGDISTATGYQSAYIIKSGRTILGDGGGICQDSTTLFRAVLEAGLPVIERRAHSYRVVYYEKGGFKPGLDATVFSPTTDFKFKNDTPAHILIQAYVVPAQAKLTYEIYGTADGRFAQITNHRVWDQVPPPEPLYQDDPTLPAGTVKQIDFAAWGAKAAFDYRVVRDNEILTERTFYSNFSPWQAVYLRGTGG